MIAAKSQSDVCEWTNCYYIRHLACWLADFLFDFVFAISWTLLKLGREVNIKGGTHEKREHSPSWILCWYNWQSNVLVWPTKKKSFACKTLNAKQLLYQKKKKKFNLTCAYLPSGPSFRSQPVQLGWELRRKLRPDERLSRHEPDAACTQRDGESAELSHGRLSLVLHVHISLPCFLLTHRPRSTAVILSIFRHLLICNYHFFSFQSPPLHITLST